MIHTFLCRIIYIVVQTSHNLKNDGDHEQLQHSPVELTIELATIIIVDTNHCGY